MVSRLLQNYVVVVVKIKYPLLCILNIIIRKEE